MPPSRAGVWSGMEILSPISEGLLCVAQVMNDISVVSRVGCVCAPYSGRRNRSRHPVKAGAEAWGLETQPGG